MDPVTAVTTVFKKYIDPSGRARRSEYWWFTAFIALGYAVLVGLTAVADAFGILLLVFYAAIFIPGIMVGIRRLHDTGRAGWWLLIALVPIVGGIVLLVFTVMDSQPGGNQFGISPKQLAAPGY